MPVGSWRSLAAGLILVGLVGCAGEPGGYQPVGTPVQPASTAGYDRPLVDAAAAPEEQDRTLRAAVRIDTFDEGSAAARLLMAGLGQMHIAGTLTPTGGDARSLGTYNLDKRSGWGGISGAAADMQDVEVGFVDAAASAILGLPPPC